MILKFLSFDISGGYLPNENTEDLWIPHPIVRNRHFGQSLVGEYFPRLVPFGPFGFFQNFYSQKWYKLQNELFLFIYQSQFLLQKVVNSKWKINLCWAGPFSYHDLFYLLLFISPCVYICNKNIVLKWITISNFHIMNMSHFHRFEIRDYYCENTQIEQKSSQSN